MSVDDSVVEAVAKAVAASPDNQALRIHLTSLLVQSSRFSEALEHCALILSQQPDNLEALRYAAESSEGVGDIAKAESYKRLYQALSGNALHKPSEQKTQGNTQPHSEPATHKEQEVDESDEIELRNNVVPLRVIEGGSSGDDLFEAENPEVKQVIARR